MEHPREAIRQVSISVVRNVWNGKDYGNNVCFHRWWLVRDSCGIVCAVFTWLLLGYAEFAVNGVIISSAISREANYFALFNGILFNGLVFLAFVSHLRTVMTEPGIVPRNTATDERIRSLELAPGTVIMRCPKCICIKPERAHHCSICKRCVRRMDHHCPWVNNCIGENNQKYFVLFTMYIAALSIHAIILTVHQFILCVDKDFVGCAALTPPAAIILLIFLLFEGLLFFLFTVIMFCTQVCSIWNDETVLTRVEFVIRAHRLTRLNGWHCDHVWDCKQVQGIEQLQSERDRTWTRRKKCQGLRSVFGDNFSIWWLCPLTAPHLIGRDKPYQYSVLAADDE